MNKKRFFAGIGAVAIASVVAFNFNIGLRGEFLSDLTLANIEALALGEDFSGCQLVDPNYYYDGCRWQLYSCPSGPALDGPLSCDAK